MLSRTLGKSDGYFRIAKKIRITAALKTKVGTRSRIRSTHTTQNVDDTRKARWRFGGWNGNEQWLFLLWWWWCGWLVAMIIVQGKGEPPKRPNTHTHGSTHGHTISKNATSVWLFTCYVLLVFFFRFCNKLKLGLLGENFNTGLPQIPFRMCFECVSLVSPMATAQFQHGLLVDPYIGCVFRRAISTVCQFIIAAKYENSGCREVKCICLRSRMKRALHSKMWLRCVKFYVWFWSHDEVAIPHCLLQKFANSGCTN